MIIKWIIETKAEATFWNQMVLFIPWEQVSKQMMICTAVNLTEKQVSAAVSLSSMAKGTAPGLS